MAVIQIFLWGLVPAVVLISLGSIVESICPAGRRTPGAVAFNLLYYAPASFIQAVLTPLAAGITTLAVNAMGGGLVRLPTTGWGLAVGVAGYLAAMDLGEYLFHRAQHRFAWMWAMHALHHSDTQINVSTTVRHFWPEAAIKTLTIYLAVGLIFKAAPVIVTIYGFLTLYNYFAHMNVRVGFGRWAFALNSPQYHRLHHSSRIEDRDRNFAALLPLYDVLFGTFSPPREGDYPETGLDGGEAPAGVVEALVWPLSATARQRSSPRDL